MKSQKQKNIKSRLCDMVKKVKFVAIKIEGKETQIDLKITWKSLSNIRCLFLSDKKRRLKHSTYAVQIILICV